MLREVRSPAQGCTASFKASLPQSSTEVVIGILFCPEPGQWSEPMEAAGASVWPAGGSAHGTS